jgi:hypothetical protein
MRKGEAAFLFVPLKLIARAGSAVDADRITQGHHTPY